MTTKLLAAAIVLLAPLSAAAQGPADAPDQASPGGQGPMIIEQVHSGFLLAPDVKVTEFDHRALPMVGGYAGWVADQTVFFGGGGYWLANNSHDREMAYGGFVVQWFAHSTEHVGFVAKGLIGGGSARLSDTITETFRVPAPMPFVNGRPDPSHMAPPTTQTLRVPVRFRTDLFVAEPEADVRLRLSHLAAVTAGIGYRFAAGEFGNRARLQGAVASVGVQFGGGF